MMACAGVAWLVVLVMLVTLHRRGPSTSIVAKHALQIVIAASVVLSRTRWSCQCVHSASAVLRVGVLTATLALL